MPPNASGMWRNLSKPPVPLPRILQEPLSLAVSWGVSEVQDRGACCPSSQAPGREAPGGCVGVGAWPALRTRPARFPRPRWVRPELRSSYIFIFNFFFLVLGSGKSGKTYTVTILLTSWSERRNDFTVTERKHRLTCGLINHAHMYAFSGVGLHGIFPFSRRVFELQTVWQGSMK